MRIKIELTPAATERLIDVAIANRRPVPLQAEVLLLQALGLWPPAGPEPVEPEPAGVRKNEPSEVRR